MRFPSSNKWVANIKKTHFQENEISVLTDLATHFHVSPICGFIAVAAPLGKESICFMCHSLLHSWLMSPEVGLFVVCWYSSRDTSFIDTAWLILDSWGQWPFALSILILTKCRDARIIIHIYLELHFKGWSQTGLRFTQGFFIKDIKLWEAIFTNILVKSYHDLLSWCHIYNWIFRV